MNHLPYCPLCGARIDLDVPGSCPSCGEPHFRNARPTAGGLLVHEGKVLLLKRAIDPYRGYWDIPGGFCDGAELPVDAAVREVFEETGIRARAGRQIAMLLDTYTLGAVRFDTLNTYFELQADDIDIRLDPDENSEAGWFGPGDIPWPEIAFPHHQLQVLEAWCDGQVV
ncbi:MAG: NUDIX domain-containing protein [Acidimicrobiales bacterium]|nr:NUDIX domain-containing protein [Acidimicrobiales bacterium]